MNNGVRNVDIYCAKQRVNLQITSEPHPPFCSLGEAGRQWWLYMHAVVEVQRNALRTAEQRRAAQRYSLVPKPSLTFEGLVPRLTHHVRTTGGNHGKPGTSLIPRPHPKMGGAGTRLPGNWATKVETWSFGLSTATDWLWKKPAASHHSCSSGAVSSLVTSRKYLRKIRLVK